VKVIRSLAEARVRSRLCLAMGVFDGVHVGHQAIISQAVRMASSGRGLPAVLTFDPHPDTIISPRGAPPLLTTTDEKLTLLRELGIRLVVVARFDRALAETPAADFARCILAERLRAGCLIVGEGWRFGARGEGTTDLLRRFAPELGFDVCPVPHVTVRHRVVSSTHIRDLISVGRVDAARDFLGRWYEITGPVVAGDRRGRTLGFPTANLDLPPEKLTPPNGIYACWAGVRKPRPAVASIGVRPTFENAGRTKIEVHLLTPPRLNLLGRLLRVQFVSRLREERRFPTPDALIGQMQRDRREAGSVLSELAE